MMVDDIAVIIEAAGDMARLGVRAAKASDDDFDDLLMKYTQSILDMNNLEAAFLHKWGPGTTP